MEKLKEKYDVIEKIKPLLNMPERFKDIEDYLCDNSNLPGPRGNLTLAFKFAECFESNKISKTLFQQLIIWVSLSQEEAPANSPKEFLPFCAILSLGSYYIYANGEEKSIIMEQFRKAMNDGRWRTREGSAMGLQKIAEEDFSIIEKYFLLWYPNSSCLEKRGFQAALAHPPILKNRHVVEFSIKISDDILSEITSYDRDKLMSEEFKVLSKGLQYSLSVFIAYLPEEGFAFLRKYTKINNPELRKIIKSNLGKARLSKKFPHEVNEILAYL